MDRTAFESRLRNLHSWVGHLESTVESALPQTLVELGPAGDETPQDVRNAAEALRGVARCLGDVMNAYDVLLESVDRPRRYDDFLQDVGDDPDESPVPSEDGDLDEDSPEINRARFARLAGELHYDVGWLQGAIRGALVCCDEDHIDGHLNGLATGIEELMISYDRLQDVIGVLPARHCAFFDQMVVIEEVRTHRRRVH